MRRAAQPTEAARHKMRGVLYNIDGRYTQYKGPGGRRRFLKDQIFPINFISICVLKFETAEINGPVSIGEW